MSDRTYQVRSMLRNACDLAGFHPDEQRYLTRAAIGFHNAIMLYVAKCFEESGQPLPPDKRLNELLEIAKKENVKLYLSDMQMSMLNERLDFICKFHHLELTPATKEDIKCLYDICDTLFCLDGLPMPVGF